MMSMVRNGPTTVFTRIPVPTPPRCFGDELDPFGVAHPCGMGPEVGESPTTPTPFGVSIRRDTRMCVNGLMRQYRPMIYLDHAATTPMRPEVWEAMAPYGNDRFGNPSGVHAVSRTAKNALEDAREEIAALIGAAPMEVVFTSGGTESDNLAIKGAVLNSTSRQGLVTICDRARGRPGDRDFLKRLGFPGVDPRGGRRGSGHPQAS